LFFEGFSVQLCELIAQSANSVLCNLTQSYI
jgi:hypothetical protein